MTHSAANTMPRLKDLGFWLRCSISIIVLGILGGYGVAGYYLHQHYENRDERPGLTMTDIQGAYAGAMVPSPLLEAIESGHPDTLNTGDRGALVAWLKSHTTERDYENFDLDPMPADVLFDNCMSCHGRNATGETAFTDLPLEYWDDISPIAVTREIKPKDFKIVIASIHAHLPSMAVVLFVMTALGAMTRWPGFITGLVSTTAGLGLLADFGFQVYARNHPDLAIVIVAGGVVYAGGVTLLGLSVLLDCWLPGGGRRSIKRSEKSGSVPDPVSDDRPRNRPV